MEKKQTEQFANSLYKNVKMAHDSVGAILKKVEDKSLKMDLELQKKDYSSYISKLETVADEFGVSLEPENKMTKTMAQMGISMHTAFDNSPSKVAQMMIEGSTMGVIESTKALNNNQNGEPKLKQLAGDILNFERNNVERMKNYL
ncbi:MAG: hypothetical protein RR549_00895 [Oscillospiraceae bacterium]